MQSAFDEDWKRGRISRDGWYKNASDNAVIGYILMLQTGDLVKPIDKNRVSRIDICFYFLLIFYKIEFSYLNQVLFIIYKHIYYTKLEMNNFFTFCLQIFNLSKKFLIFNRFQILLPRTSNIYIFYCQKDVTLSKIKQCH
jgi:hypothetical protein